MIEFDVEQDRPRGAIEREIIEQVAEIDVELIADRCDGGEADVPLRGPIDHAGRDCAGLGNQRELARHRHACRKAGVEFLARHEDAQTIWTDEPQAFGARRLFAGLRERARAMPEPGGDDDGRRRTHFGGSRHHIGHGIGRHRDDDQIGSRWQVRQILERR